MSSSDATVTGPASPRKKSWVKKALLGVGVVAVVLVVGGYFLVPVIASSKAPGLIEEAAAKQIAGTVKVKSASIGWGGPIVVQGVELRDPEGGVVGTFNVESSLGIWKVLGGLKNLGTAKLSGRLDIVRTVDESGNGTTNLERALKSRGTPSSTGGTGGGSSGSLPDIDISLDIAGVDATFTEKDASGAVRGRAAMKQLKGPITVSTTGTTTAKANLAAEFAETLDGPATGSLKLDAQVDGAVQGRQLTLMRSSVDASVAAKGVPVNLIDALAAQGGLLSGALGATADATVRVKGPVSALDADVVLASPNAAADLAIKTEGQGDAARVRATRKGTVTLRSLAFVERIPGLSQGLHNAGIAVTQWPGASVSIDALDIPAAGGSWAGARAELSAQTTGEVRGTVVRPRPDGQSGAPEALVVRQLTLGVMARDLVRGMDVVGFTSATIGGQSAGELDLNVQVSELIGPDGKLLLTGGSMPGRIVGKLEARSVATGLLAPFASAAGVPIDMPADVGPTLDLVLNASTRPGAGGGTPPTDLTAQVRSANITASSTLVYEATGLGIPQGAEPTRITVLRAAPLLQRVLASGATAGEPTPAVNGAGRVEVTITTLRVPVSGKQADVKLATAAATATVSDLEIAVQGERPLRIGADRFTATMGVAPQSPSTLTVDGALKLDGSAMDVKGDLRITGLTEEQELPRLGAIGTRRASGTLSLTGAIGGALQSVALGPDANPALRRVVAELVGRRVDVRIDLGDKPAGTAAQPLALTVGGDGLNAIIKSELKADTLEVSQLDGSTTLTDPLARAVLELVGQTGEAVAQARLREPTGVNIKVQPLSVPLKPGTLTPNWSAARSIVTTNASLARPAIVDGLRVEGRTISAGVAGFSLDASVPLAVLDNSPTRAPDSTGLRLNATMDVIGNDPADVLAKLRAEGGSGKDGGRPRYNITLSDIATARMDEIAGQGGLLPGLLGERATILAAIDQKTDQAELGIEVDSPQMTVKNGRFLLGKEAYRAAGPFAITLNASPALIERRVLGVQPGEAGGLRVAEPVALTLNVASLAVSASGPDAAGGPLKPGVFNIDAVVTTPRIVLLTAPAGQPARASEILDFTATLKSAGNASRTGLTFSATVGSLKSDGRTVSEPTSIRGTVDNLADVGGRIQADLAVLNLKATTGKIPTPIIQSLTGGGKHLAELLGDEVTADIDARDVSKTGSSGFVSIKLQAPNANLIAGGPVVNGVMDTGAPGATPVRAELKEFRFKGEGELMKIFPIFAQMERTSGEANRAPAMITSRALRLPIDGDMSKLSGELDVDLGRVDYEFSQHLGVLLDETIFRGGRGEDQRPIPKFTFRIDRGIIRYGSVQEKVLLPVRNLDFHLRGVVNLVDRRLDVVTYVPTIAAAPGLTANLNKTIGSAIGNLVPGVVEKVTAAPIRVSGPMDNPSTGYAPDVVLDEFKDVLNPENLLKGIGDLLGGGNKPAPKPAAPAPKPAPGGPAGPGGSPPAKPASPRAPSNPPR